MRRYLFLIVMLGALAGCHRAVYTNVQGDGKPQGLTREKLEALPDYDDTSWQHFFIYGLLPSETTIEAAQLCKGAEHIAAIKTKQTFLEGLVASVAGYYINIYSPYDGHVVCDNSTPVKR